MADDLHTRLNIVREKLAAQNEHLASMNEALGALPPGMELDVPDEWMEAFEAATDVPATFGHRAPVGAMRA